MTVIHRGTVEHYRWGAANDGWHLVKTDDLSVIEECVVAGGSEVRHLHARARQFFYILAGEAVLEVSGVQHRLAAGQGIDVAPGVAHCFHNQSEADVTFLVISAPASHADRVNL